MQRCNFCDCISIVKIVPLHGFINGTVDIGIDGFPLLRRMCLNNVFFSFGHYKIDTIIIAFHVLVYRFLLCFTCWRHGRTS